MYVVVLFRNVYVDLNIDLNFKTTITKMLTGVRVVRGPTKI